MAYTRKLGNGTIDGLGLGADFESTWREYLILSGRWGGRKFSSDMRASDKANSNYYYFNALAKHFCPFRHHIRLQ
jgi:hypothetical protein